MPIYETDMSYEDMKKAAQTHWCAECGGIINVAWSAEKNCYMLRCHDLTHSTITKHRKLSPEEIEGRKIFDGGTVYMDTKTLQKQDPTQMLRRIDKARFPQDLNPQQQMLMAQVAIEYGLDPLFGELVLYQGRPYVSIDARRRKAQETGTLDGINSRPATKEEREAREVPQGDYLYKAEVWVKGASHPFEGWGRVRTAETKGDSHLPLVKDPGDMAEKRAEAEGLRRAYHLPLPSFEDIIEGDFTQVKEKNGAPELKTRPPKEQTSTAASPPVNRATDAQKRKIKTDAQKMGYTDSDLLGIIRGKWEVKSIDELTVPQATTLINMIARGEGLPANTQAEGEAK